VDGGFDARPSDHLDAKPAVAWVVDMSWQRGVGDRICSREFVVSRHSPCWAAPERQRAVFMSCVRPPLSLVPYVDRGIGRRTGPGLGRTDSSGERGWRDHRGDDAYLLRRDDGESRRPVPGWSL